jgi:RNA polymerase sporulation-specific sigma factor
MSDENQEADLQLINRIRQEADNNAKDALVIKYMPMVRHIIRTQSYYHTDQEDLIQEGLIGLLKAIREYRPDKFPVKFSTFAYICIMRRIFNVLKLWRSKKYQILSSAISLHANQGADDSRTLLDTMEQPGLSPQEIVEEKWSRNRLEKVLRAYLSPVELAVIERYLQGMTSSEIQQYLGFDAKVVDNARTRARQKLGRVVQQYGSLIHPAIPLKTRKRSDLCLALRKLG